MDRVAYFENKMPQMLADLAALTDVESPSASLEALRTCANYLDTLGSTLLGRRPERIVATDRPHLLWSFGTTPKIVLIGHFDTVHPLGTAATFCFTTDGDIARGPGVCDMKGGVVIALHAVAHLLAEHGEDALDGLCLFLNSDEEIGSPTSLATITSLAKSARYALAFENAGSNGEVKTERRGRSGYEVRVNGRAAHVADEPERGINALREMCALFEPVMAMSDPVANTSVIPTTATAGMTFNTIPESAVMNIDVRCSSRAEQQRVDRQIRQIEATLTEATVDVTGEMQHPPMPAESSAELFDLASHCWKSLGYDELESMAVGGSADACQFAAAGVQTLDGLGAVGGDDHSTREWIYIDSLPRRAALASSIIGSLLDLEGATQSGPNTSQAIRPNA